MNRVFASVLVIAITASLASCSVMWTHDFSVPGNMFVSAPTVASGIVYAAASGSTTLEVVGLAERTGHVIWNRTLTCYPPSVFSCSNMARPVVGDGVVIIGTMANIFALNAATGATIWSQATTNPDQDGYGPPTVANGLVIAMYDAAGVFNWIAWSTATGARQFYVAASSGSQDVGGLISVSGDGVAAFVFTATPTAVRLSTGTPLWTLQTMGETNAASNGDLFFWAGAGVNATTGATVWQSDLPESFMAPVYVDGIVVSISAGGQLYGQNASTGAMLWGSTKTYTTYSDLAVSRVNHVVSFHNGSTVFQFNAATGSVCTVSVLPLTIESDYYDNALATGLSTIFGTTATGIFGAHSCAKPVAFSKK